MSEENNLDLSQIMQDLWMQLREHCEEILEYDNEIDVAAEEYTLPADIDQLQKTIEAFDRQWVKEM